jgi:splicing factor 3B subunit 2
VTPSGLTSIPAGMETPDMIELRKKKSIEEAMEAGPEQPSLYTMIPEKKMSIGGAMMGSSHVYEIPGVSGLLIFLLNLSS